MGIARHANMLIWLLALWKTSNEKRHIKYKKVHVPCAKIGTIQHDASNTNNPNRSIVVEAKLHGPTVYLYYVRTWHYKSAVKHVSNTIWMRSYVGDSPLSSSCDHDPCCGWRSTRDLLFWIIRRSEIWFTCLDRNLQLINNMLNWHNSMFIPAYFTNIWDQTSFSK